VNLGHWVLLVVTLGLWAPFALVAYLKTRCTDYALSNERLFLKTGVLSRHEDQIELYRVKDTRLEQPFALRVVGLSNVVISTSDASHPLLVLSAIKNGQEVREHLRSHVEKARDKKRVRELDAV
jgi:uncharacterized membrane protein YdbT with pleckstrin-like domain